MSHEEIAEDIMSDVKSLMTLAVKTRCTLKIEKDNLAPEVVKILSKRLEIDIEVVNATTHLWLKVSNVDWMGLVDSNSTIGIDFRSIHKQRNMTVSPPTPIEEFDALD